MDARRVLQAVPVASATKIMGQSRERFLNIVFLSLVAPCVAVQLPALIARWSAGHSRQGVEGVLAGTQRNEGQPLRQRYLAVFWLFKMADWLQGPYFYEVYASKVINGRVVSEDLVSKLFLTGFGTSALIGASVGGLVDTHGRKAGSLAFALFYALSALSTHARSFASLFLGRVCGGIGSSLLSSAPEAWLVAAYEQQRLQPEWLKETFAKAFLGDSVAAIIAGQIASALASRWGPEAPFLASQAFLAGGAAVAASTWQENFAASATDTAPSSSSASVCKSRRPGQALMATISDAWTKMLADPRILGVGAVQALFEGSMYIFVMQWPPAVKAVMKGGDVPFGKIFSCLMASTMLGSSLFGKMAESVSTEKMVASMLAVATGAMGVATTCSNSLSAVLSSFFMFEACVGVYFPAIGTLRSRYVPDSHRSVMTAMFQIPLNLIVVAVMLSQKRLGLKGSLACSTVALKCAFLAQLFLCMPRTQKQTCVG